MARIWTTYFNCLTCSKQLAIRHSPAIKVVSLSLSARQTAALPDLAGCMHASQLLHLMHRDNLGNSRACCPQGCNEFIHLLVLLQLIQESKPPGASALQDGPSQIRKERRVEAFA